MVVYGPCLSRTACERLADGIPVTTCEASALNSIPHVSRLGHCRGLEQHYAGSLPQAKMTPITMPSPRNIRLVPPPIARLLLLRLPEQAAGFRSRSGVRASRWLRPAQVLRPFVVMMMRWRR